MNFGSLKPTTPHVLTRAEFFPPIKVISKWQDSTDEVEAHGRTAGGCVLALDGPQVRAIGLC